MAGSGNPQRDAPATGVLRTGSPLGTARLRLLCDEMLAGLARWLRAAGYDTALAEPGTPDAAVLDQCGTEGRVLISRDRHLVQEAGKSLRAVLLTGNDMDNHARSLAESLDLDWTVAPFTRCMIDNTVLRPANASDLAHVPPQARNLPGPFRVCPRCGRTFWPGSHVRRMDNQLRRWRDLAGSAGP